MHHNDTFSFMKVFFHIGEFLSTAVVYKVLYNKFITDEK